MTTLRTTVAVLALALASGCALQRDVVYVTAPPTAAASATELGQLAQQCEARLKLARQEVDAIGPRRAAFAVGRAAQAFTRSAPSSLPVDAIGGMGAVVELVALAASAGAPPPSEAWYELTTLSQAHDAAQRSTDPYEQTLAYFDCAKGHPEFAVPTQLEWVPANNRT